MTVFFYLPIKDICLSLLGVLGITRSGIRQLEVDNFETNFMSGFEVNTLSLDSFFLVLMGMALHRFEMIF